MAKIGETHLVEAQFPIRGIVRRFAYQKQPAIAASTVDAENTWPDSAGVPSGATQAKYIRQRGGSRAGLEKAFPTQIGGGNPIRALGTIQFVTGSQVHRRLVAISNGALWMENAAGVLTSVGGTFNPQKQLQMFERNQILYIADHSDVIADSSAAYKPKKLDPTGPTLSNWDATDGTIPYGSTCACLWRDRAILGGGTGSPFGVFASRQGDLGDWDYSETDSGAAWSLVLSSSGQLGDGVMALVPHSDDCLVVFCSTSAHILRGDPGYGGTADIISSRIGCLGPNAWCLAPDNQMYWLSQDGLYRMPGGCAATTDNIVSVSRPPLPEEMV